VPGSTYWRGLCSGHGGIIVGSQTLNQVGQFPPEPGARGESASFVHHNRLYIFGGGDTNEGWLAADVFNDFCKSSSLYSYCAHTVLLSGSYDLNGVDGWTWLGGSSERNQKGEYGVKNVADRSKENIPGARYGSSSFVDPTTARGFIFGGYGYDKNGDYGYLNDFFSYDVNGVDGWIWKGGSNYRNQNGVYGTKGEADPTNFPGARYNSRSFVDTSRGLVYIFGGYGYDSAGNKGYLNDLCMCRHHCTHTVLTLYSYCTHTVLTLYSYQGRMT
jgi:hypothetical protein